MLLIHTRRSIQQGANSQRHSSSSSLSSSSSSTRTWSWDSSLLTVAFVAGLGFLYSTLFGIEHASSEAANGGKGQRLTLEETREAIQKRLDRYSPAMAKSLLKWECREKDGRQYVQFCVNPNADHFCLLLSSLFEVGQSSVGEEGTGKGKMVEASLHAWDNEHTSTGIHVHLKGKEGSKLGGGVIITLPWTDSEPPTVELFSGEGGFLPEEASAAARMIRMGNLRRVPDDFLLGGSNNLHDFFFSPGGFPGPQMAAGMGGAEGGREGAKGKVPEGRAAILSKLQELGAQVYEGTGEGSAAKSLGWDYLAGVDDIKQQVEETVMLSLTHPEEFARIMKGTRAGGGSAGVGSNKPRAVLFEGPPGCGKTSMGRMMAARAGLPMVYLPLEAVTSKWYGEGEKRLAQVFALVEGLAKEGGALLFLDEIEALAVSRDAEIHEASRRMLSVLLRSIDGFQSAQGVTVVAATNRVADIDSALRSRFDLLIPFPLPDKRARHAILHKFTVHLSERERGVLAGALEGLSGRNLREVCEAAERRWAGKVIRGEAPRGSLPPASEYESVGKERLRSGLQ